MAQIKTYARLKPSKKAYTGYEFWENILKIHIPDNKDFLIKNPQHSFRSSLSYEIAFTEIFRPEAAQEDVFNVAAKEIIQGFINGYNGTIFTYGQTGTGKTYTVEGNTAQYSTSGLSTRALGMIYQQLENRVEDHISVYLSYLEIYQEIAYDLLNPTSRASIPVIPFAKVTVFEGPQDSYILRGLSLHLAANEEIAQMLLVQGQANRKVAETPVNQRSSRSHAVFTVYLQVRKNDSKVMVNSKLHLVDLAGSERVSKTGVDGQQLTEAKSINLSLHHLETVIIALQSYRMSSAGGSGVEDRSKSVISPLKSQSSTTIASCPSSDSGNRPSRFVPYRNSLLTMVLKDSLGGNCLTAMIATISMEPENVGESISTCRFAQRVARISNNARRNVEVDDKTLIKRLKHKITCLRREVAALKSQGRSDTRVSLDKASTVLSEQDKTVCAKIMEGFLQGVVSDPVNAGIYDHYHFLECLHVLKQQCMLAKAPPAKILTTEQRQNSLLESSETTIQVQPQSPHQSSADHATSKAMTIGTSPILSQQQSMDVCMSEQSVKSDNFFSASCNKVESAAKRVDSQSKERKGNEINQHIRLNSRESNKLFDGPRIVDIKKMEPKLIWPAQEQSVKTEQPEQVTKNIYIHRLQEAEDSLRYKLKVLDKKIVEQRNYILWLKNNRASTEQISKEHMLEIHHLKCQATFKDKLSKLVQKKIKLMRFMSPDRERSLSTRSTMKCTNDKHAQQQRQEREYGSSYQLTDVSGSPEKEQQQLDSSNLSKTKYTTKSKQQTSMKEASVLEKFKDLKQKPRTGLQENHHKYGPNKGSYQVSEIVQPIRRYGVWSPGYVNRLEDRIAVGRHLQQGFTKVHSPRLSTSPGTWSKDISCSETSQSTEKQVKSIENYLVFDDIDKTKATV